MANLPPVVAARTASAVAGSATATSIRTLVAPSERSLPPVDDRIEVRTLTEAELHGWRENLLFADSERDEALRHDPTEPRALARMSV